MPDLPGRELARELIEKSRGESRATPVEEMIEAVRKDGLTADAAHRLMGRLWTLERMFYYVYGGWGQGLEINDFPPSVKYLFSKQIVDESTHEMLYLDAQLHKGFVPTQKDAFRHPYCVFTLDSALAYYVFSLRNLATYLTRSGSPPSISGQKSSNSVGWRASRRHSPTPNSKVCSKAKPSKTAVTSIWGGASSKSL